MEIYGLSMDIYGFSMAAPATSKRLL
jgi:hypothetical protein